MTNIKEINRCVEIFSNKKTKLNILHCVSGYPIKEEEANLSNIHYLKNIFKNIKIGYSDHTKGIITSYLAVAAGAQIIEKHFMLTNDNKCIDAAVSIDENQMNKLILKINKVEKIFQKPNFKIKKVEKNILQFRRHTK